MAQKAPTTPPGLTHRYVIIRGRSIGFGLVPVHCDHPQVAATHVAHMLGFKLMVQRDMREPVLANTFRYSTVLVYDDDDVLDLWVCEQHVDVDDAHAMLGTVINQAIGRSK